MSAFHFKRLRTARMGGVDVVGFKPAPRGSVLAGQLLKHFIGNYADEAAALAAHPDASGYSHPLIDPEPSLAHLPGEDDPVPGGRWPDDIGEGS